jgi:hypothetical protein
LWIVWDIPRPERHNSSFGELFRETFALPNSPHRIPAQWPARQEVLREFQWTRFADGLRVVIPHWFPAALSLGFAALCAFKRPWRYSLRTILVATTVLAGLLGLAVYEG